jgi:carbonic anhydrase
LSLQSEDYNYTKKGEDWDGYCENGTAQSPIDIPEEIWRGISLSQSEYHWSTNINDRVKNSDVLDFYVEFAPVTNLAVTLTDAKEFKLFETYGILGFVDPTDTVKLFQLKQFHFHAGAEHTFDN